jgi:hypothetical protein
MAALPQRRQREHHARLGVRRGRCKFRGSCNSAAAEGTDRDRRTD